MLYKFIKLIFMKNRFFLFLILTFSIISSYASGEIEKGKWNFIKDQDYCYIGSSPVEEKIPEGKNRGDTYILVYKINKNPNAIIQINAGYPYNEDEPVSVKIDKVEYEFYSQDDSAWTDSDNKIIYAMQKGLDLTITGISTRGTKTVDTYTLSGFTAAYNKLSEDC